MSISRSATTVTLTWKSVPGTTYLIQWRTNLTAIGDWNNLGDPIVADTDTTTHSHTPPATEPRRFCRVRTPP